jgi:hypothetical protein
MVVGLIDRVSVNECSANSLPVGRLPFGVAAVDGNFNFPKEPFRKRVRTFYGKHAVRLLEAHDCTSTSPHSRFRRRHGTQRPATTVTGATRPAQGSRAISYRYLGDSDEPEDAGEAGSDGWGSALSEGGPDPSLRNHGARRIRPK